MAYYSKFNNNISENHQKRKLTVYDLPTEITINGPKFSLLMCTLLDLISGQYFL